MRANALMKHNIDALLRGRHQTRHDLAQWCRFTDAWISKIMGEDRREFPMKHFDRIADFFGIAVYQLLQPGISSLTERRAGRDRRTGLDRRISQARHSPKPQRTPEMETVTPYERAHLARLRRLTAEDRKHLEYLIDRALLAQDVAPKTAAPADPQIDTAPQAETAPRTPKRRHG